MRRDDPELVPVGATTPLPFPDPLVIDALQPLVLPRRLERMRTVISGRTSKTVAVLEGLTDPHNTSAILRSCDAFGIQRVHVVETDQSLKTSRTVSKGAERWLTLDKYSDPTRCFERVRDQGFQLWVASMSGERTLEELRHTEKLALVFGNEHRGPSECAVKHATGTFSIPMTGFVESLNVSVAAAISLFTVRSGKGGDLSQTEQDALLARYLYRTVREPRQAIERHQAGTSSEVQR